METSFFHTRTNIFKIDVVLDDTSNNAVANKPVTSIIKKIISWH